MMENNSMFEPALTSTRTSKLDDMREDELGSFVRSEEWPKCYAELAGVGMWTDLATGERAAINAFRTEMIHDCNTFIRYVEAKRDCLFVQKWIWDNADKLYAYVDDLDRRERQRVEELHDALVAGATT
jgi:hypothetical protein